MELEGHSGAVGISSAPAANSCFIKAANMIYQLWQQIILRQFELVELCQKSEVPFRHRSKGKEGAC